MANLYLLVIYVNSKNDKMPQLADVFSWLGLEIDYRKRFYAMNISCAKQLDKNKDVTRYDYCDWWKCNTPQFFQIMATLLQGGGIYPKINYRAFHFFEKLTYSILGELKNGHHCRKKWGSKFEVRKKGFYAKLIS